MPGPGKRRSNEIELPVAVGFGGVNYAVEPHSIDDDELRSSFNWWLSPYGKFRTRPGTASMLDEALSSSIRNIMYHPASDKMVVAAGAKLYSVPWNSGNGGAATELGSLSGTVVTEPVVGVNFSSELFVASGGAIQKFDGTTLGTITEDAYSKPINTVMARAVRVKTNRLWVLEAGGSEVKFSGAGDYTDWGRSGAAPDGEGLLLNGGGFAIESGDGDCMTGCGSYQDRLVCFKGSNRKTIHQVFGETSSEFYPKRASEGLSCKNAQAVTEASTDLIFCGQGGVYSFSIVDEYGSVDSVPISLKVNQRYLRREPKSACFVPDLGYVFVVTDGGGIFAYHRGAESWYPFEFEGFTPTCVACVGDSLVIGSAEGQIYRFDQSLSTDDGTDFLSEFTTKTFMATTKSQVYTKRAYFFVQGGNDRVAYVQAMDSMGDRVVRTRTIAATESAVAGFDDPDVGFDDDSYGFDMAESSRRIVFPVNRSMRGVALRISTMGTMEIQQIIITANKMHRGGGRSGR